MVKMAMESIDQWSDEEQEIQKKYDRIILKNIPNEFTRDGLINMCRVYGEVTDFHWPDDKPYAFITYKTNAEALNILRRFQTENPALPIAVDFANEKENHFKPPTRSEFKFLADYCDDPAIISNKEPFRNVLDMDKREIKGPFSDPVEVYKCDSLIEPRDYRNLLLRTTDRTREFLWDSNDEAFIDYEKRQKKIIHGRVILKSISEAVNKEWPSNSISLKKKSFSFNSDLIPVVAVCTNCARPGDMNCKDCSKIHCSLECHAAFQRKDGQNPKENLISMAMNTRKIEKHVKITAVINHRLVFVRPANDHDEVEFARLLCDTARYAKNADTLEKLPAVGTFVLAKFGYYQRALVLKRINDTEVAVAFIDFGNVETVDFREIKVMPDELTMIKRFATKIALSKIDHNLMNNKALEILYDYLVRDAELEIEIAPKKEPNEATMAKLRADQWINELVNASNIDGIVASKKIQSIENRVYHIENKPLDYEQMSNKKITILNNAQIKGGELTFIDSDDLNKVRENDRLVQSVCNYLFTEFANYTPRNEEFCVVKHQNRWYRSQCVEICYDGFATMYFIDYGNVQIIEICDIRPIPQCLLFKYATIEAIFFPEFLNNLELAMEKEQELVQKYSALSSWKIRKMELRTTVNKYQDEVSNLYVTLL